MAGFMGCSNITGSLSVTNNIEPAGNPGSRTDADVDGALLGFDGTSAIVGYTYNAGDTLPTVLTNMGLAAGTAVGNVMDDTDLLFIRRAGSCAGANVTASSNTPGSAQFKIADNTSCQIQQDDIVMVTNCETADIFGVSNDPSDAGPATIAHGANWNATPIFANGYGADSFILKMNAMVFYIGVGSSGEPALFRRELRLGTMTSIELVEGVEDMTILYGIDTDGNNTADRYADVAAIDADPADDLDWEEVVSIRVTAASRSIEDNIATSTTASGDRRIRRNFTTTVGIRNRMG